MQPCGVFLVEGGFPAALPGLPRDTLSAPFPFWGSHQILDFAAAGYRGLSGAWTILGESRFRGLQARIPPGQLAGEDTVVSLPPGAAGGLRDLLARLRSCPCSKVLIAPVSQVCLPEPSALAQGLRSARGIVKLALGGSPTDTYLADRRALVRALAGLGAHLEAGPAGEELTEPLFQVLLARAFETIVDLPGTVFFRDSLTQLHEGNLWLARNFGSPEASAALSRLSRLSRPEAPSQTVIERGGEVRRSFLAAGCRVEGYVEDSVLFPGVVVHKGAVVYNSVIMTANRIGARAQVCRTLILPEGDGGASVLNVGENACIGLKASSAANLLHPGQIREGLTVLGPGSQIPPGFTVGPGCLVGAGVTAQGFKGMRELRKGNSLLCTTDR